MNRIKSLIPYPINPVEKSVSLTLEATTGRSVSSLTILGLVLGLFLCLLTLPAQAAIDVYQFDSEQQEQQYRTLIEEFRCPKCQNQNLASSDSIISQDLKQKTYDMVQAGHSDDEIRNFMLERYGDFITYNPPIRPTTYILWYFPPILLILLLGFWFWRTKRQSLSMNSNHHNDASQSMDDSIDDGNDHTLSQEEQATLDALLATHSDTSNPNHADKYDLDKENTPS